MRKYAVLLLLAVLAVFGHWRCASAILTAPAGTSITLFANPGFIPAYGGVSVISALLISPTGEVVHDGTVVQFFTTLGRVDPEAKTSNGVATVNLVSDSHSGTATVTAVSGGSAASTPSVSASASPGTTSTPVSSGSSASSQVQVQIGSSLPSRVQVTANPPDITGVGPARQSRIVANVYDSNGNPVVNVPVIFSVSTSTSTAPSSTTTTTTTTTTTLTAALPVRSATSGTLPAALASGSAPIYTDSNGQAVDTLLATIGPSDPPAVVTVTASTSNGASGTVDVQIN